MRPQPPALPQPIQPNPPPAAPSSPLQPQQPTLPNVHGALIRFVFPSQPNPFQTIAPTDQTTNTATQPASTTTVITTSRKEMLTTSTQNGFLFSFRTTTGYELPTPPPYTQNGPGGNRNDL